MINYSTDTIILIKLFDDNLLFVPLNGDGFKIIELSMITNFKKYIYLSLDMRLFFNLLKGPKFAYWNNAEIGCHITWKRVPNIYDRSLTYCLNFFHS